MFQAHRAAINTPEEAAVVERHIRNTYRNVGDKPLVLSSAFALCSPPSCLGPSEDNDGPSFVERHKDGNEKGVGQDLKRVLKNHDATNVIVLVACWRRSLVTDRFRCIVKVGVASQIIQNGGFVYQKMLRNKRHQRMEVLQATEDVNLHVNLCQSSIINQSSTNHQTDDGRAQEQQKKDDKIQEKTNKEKRGNKNVMKKDTKKKDFYGNLREEKDQHTKHIKKAARKEKKTNKKM